MKIYWVVAYFAATCTCGAFAFAEIQTAFRVMFFGMIVIGVVWGITALFQEIDRI